MGHAESKPMPSMKGEDSPLYFSAKLVVCHKEDGDEEELLPIRRFVDSEDGETGAVESAYYCAEHGAHFAIRCQLARPPPPNVRYGARVYVDRGATDVAYATAGAAPDPDGEVETDTSEFDHYFWFGPDETEYTVRGFYADRDESYPFVFGTPSERTVGEATKRQKTDHEDSVSRGVADAKALGAIRIQFAKVTRWLKPISKRAPLAILDGAAPPPSNLAERKGRNMATCADETASKDAAAKGCSREAVLSPVVLHECRLFYNDFQGYRSQVSIGRAMLEPDAYKGLPIDILKLPDVRRRCIETFLRALQHIALSRVTEERIAWTWSKKAVADEAPAPSTISANEPVETDQVARAICATLSPAASHVVCHGAAKADNYGEHRVQRFRGLSEAAQLEGYDVNKAKLLEFFTERPDLYDVTTATDQAAKASWLSQALTKRKADCKCVVKFAEYVID